MPRNPNLVAVLVSDHAPLFETSVPLSVFGVDRQDTGGPSYSVVAVTADEQPLSTTGNLRLAGLQPLHTTRRAGVVVVPSWRDPTKAPPSQLLDELRSAHRDGAIIMGLCLGAFVLAAAGLLDGHRTATHWHWATLLQEMYPDVQVDATALYVDSGQVITSAGTAAGLDACLHLVRRQHGAAAANAVARRMVVAPHRAGGQAQFVNAVADNPPGFELADEMTINGLLAWIGDHLQEQITVADMARRLHISRRTLDRNFRAVTGSSPLQWLLYQRVQAAQQLLETTDLPIDAVATATGFNTGLSLRAHFKRTLGIAPQHYRQTFGQMPSSVRPGVTQPRAQASTSAAPDAA